MRTETWLEQLAHELDARGVPADEVAAAVVEAQNHLTEAAAEPLADFGTPSAYAATVASALDRRRGTTGPDAPVRVAAHGVSHRFRRRPVLADVTLEVRAGEVALVMGPNGCGKSTLLRIVAGLVEPDAGSVAVDGTVGYAPQDGALLDHLRPDEHLVLWGAGRGLGRSEAVAAGRRIAAELGWDPAGEPIVRDLSGGTRQKLNVVLALLGDPDVLLLDEPYQGLDLESRQRFWALLWAWGERGGAALVVTHDHDALERAHAVIELPALGREAAR
jgi:ABC-type multidrug transport system ATPase subunit